MITLDIGNKPFRKMLNGNTNKIFFLLASQIWELAKNQDNTMDFAEAIDSSDLEFFGFTDDFIFELWGAVTDAKSGRLANTSTNIGDF